MKTYVYALLLALPVMASTAHAATEQQNKMAVCNKDATGMKGEERKAFMKDCLSKPAATTPQKAQQERMKTCNAEAKGKSGDERKQFMSQCLKKPAAG